MASSSLPVSRKRKHNKKYYINSVKKNHSGSLEVGQKGILITCNSNEKQCLKEAYNLLNEYGDELYGVDLQDENQTEKSFDHDIEAELEKEILALKSTKHLRRFQQVKTRVKNVIFIRTTVPDPTSLVNLIFENTLKTMKRRTRFILKMSPVVLTCKPFQDDLKKALIDFFELLSESEKDEVLRYKVLCKIRNNNDASKDHIIWYVREIIEKYLSSWTPCLIDPQVVVSIDILQSICCVGVLKNFTLFKKYNLAEIVPFNAPEICEKPLCNDSTIDDSLKEHSDIK